MTEFLVAVLRAVYRVRFGVVAVVILATLLAFFLLSVVAPQPAR